MEYPELEMAGSSNDHERTTPSPAPKESHPVPEGVVQILLELCQAGVVTISLGSLF